MDRWLMFALMLVMAILGLLMASRAQDGYYAIVGYLFFGFAVLFSFGLIRQAIGGSKH